jgi:hypothetical protein
MAFARLVAFLVGMGVAATSAGAQTPSAIVEEVAGHPPGVEFMDYVEPGRIIALGPADAIVLSYLNSCAREVIRGGSVKVGVDESEALTARIERTRVDCEAGKMMRAAGQTNDSASLIIRGGERPAAIRPAPDPEFTLYGLNPLVELRGVGKLVIARLDAYGEYYALTIDPERLLRGTFLDLAAEGKSPTAGGVYGARWNRRLIVFKVDPGARPGRGPIAGRLLRLDPPS